MKKTQSKTIVFIHGMMIGGWCWDKYKNFFEEKGYTCHAPTLRYHVANHDNAPDARLGVVSLLDYVQDLKNEIARLDEKPIIIGHSMGGLLAQMLAERGLADKAVFIASAPPRGILPLSWTGILGIFGWRMKVAFWRHPIATSFKGLKYMALHLTPPYEQMEVFRKTGYESGRAAFEIAFAFLDRKNVSMVNEKKITCPVLVITGAEDRLLPPSVVSKIARKYNAKYVELKNHAHWIIAEPRWEEGAEHILNFIEKGKSE